MRPESRKYIFDVHQAASGVVLMLAGKTADNFRDDRILQLATERQFEIIGEALARLRRTDPDLLAHFPDHAAIIGLRNIIAHGYDQIDHARIFDIAQNHVPVLARQAEYLLLPPPAA